MEKQASLLLVDDHPLFRQGLRTLLEKEKDLNIVGEAVDGHAAIEMVKKFSPDIVVMDITMPNLDGIEATRRILAEQPAVKVVALSMHSSRRFVNNMLQAGAAGYILKESVPEELIEGIRAVLSGNSYLSRGLSNLLVSEYKKFLAEDGAGSFSEPILLTKLHPPLVSSDIIPRPRLIELLEKGRSRAMTLISAPAGYGKSILASQWIETCGLQSVWLSLDERDNNIRLLLTSLLEGIKRAFPDASLKTQMMLRAEVLPPVEELTRYLLNDIDLMDQHFILVLDDYHHISELAVHDMISELSRYPSPMLNLVLITRYDPPLPLSQLKVHGQLIEITTDHLRFTPDETAAFIERHLQVSIDREQVIRLDKKLEGWIAGLRLASLSLGRNGKLDNLLAGLESDSFYYINEFLIREVLSNAPVKFAQCLMATSILDNFCTQLCEIMAVSLEKSKGAQEKLNGQAFVNWLERYNLFIVSLDREKYWFRYHPLFQNLLRRQMNETFTREEIDGLHLCASDWFKSKGLLDEAIHHALAGGDVVRAAEIVEENRLAMIDDEWHILEKRLSLLPEKTRQERPLLLITQAWMEFFNARYAALPSIIEAIESLIGPDSGKEPLNGEINFFKGFYSLFQKKIPQSLGYFNRALDIMPDNHHRIRGVLEEMHSIAGYIAGHGDEMVARLNALVYGDKPQHPARRYRLLSCLMIIHAMSGDLDGAAAVCQKLMDFNTKKKDEYAGFRIHYNQGLIHFLRNELDEAINHFKQVSEHKYIMSGRSVTDGITGLIFAFQALHQPDKAEAAMELLTEYSRLKNDPGIDALENSCRAHLSIMKGDLKSAVLWLKTNRAPDDELMFAWLEIPAITYCRALLAEGSEKSLHEAEERLKKYLMSNKTQHNVYHMIEIMLLQVLVNHKKGRIDEALKILRRAVKLAEPGGFIRFFVEGGDPVAGLLEQLNSQKVNSGFISRLLEAMENDREMIGREISIPPAADEPSFQPAPEIFDRPQPLIEPLSNRELDILELLVRRLQAKEIAEQKNISIATVKTHLRNIYQKLNAKNRRDAVEIAKNLGIIKGD